MLRLVSCVLSVLFVVALAGPALAGWDDDCSMDRGMVAPLLKDASSKAGRVTAIRREKYAVTQTFVFSDGVRLKATQGGCAHYGFSFEFDGLNAVKADASALTMAKIALARLSVLPLTSKSSSFVDEVRGHLAAKKFIDHTPQNGAAGTFAFDCANEIATCTISSDHPGRLTLGYDYAL